MNLKKIRISFLVLVSATLFSCGGVSYNTNHLPPDPDADVSEVFPEKIADLDGEVVRMEIEEASFMGIEAIYGDGKINIEVVRIQETNLIKDYLEKYLYPRIDALPNHSRANVNGSWTGKGSDDKKQMYAWVNDEWVFAITADKDLFDEVVDSFNFISAE